MCCQTATGDFDRALQKNMIRFSMHPDIDEDQS
jgi:hypothetical protein